MRAPEFFTIENKGRTVFGRIGAQTHVRGIGAGIPFRESEGRDFAARHSWQIFPLLLFGSEKKQWLRDTDRLMRGNKRGQVCVPTTEQHGSATVVYLG